VILLYPVGLRFVMPEIYEYWLIDWWPLCAEGALKHQPTNRRHRECVLILRRRFTSFYVQVDNRLLSLKHLSIPSRHVSWVIESATLYWTLTSVCSLRSTARARMCFAADLRSPNCDSCPLWTMTFGLLSKLKNSNNDSSGGTTAAVGAMRGSPDRGTQSHCLGIFFFSAKQWSIM